MSCKNCSSPRILTLSAKCSDCFSAEQSGGEEYHGYVPSYLNIGGSDYVEFSYCLECGQIQDNFPVPDLQKEDV